MGDETALNNVLESSGITLDSGQKTELKSKVDQYVQNTLESNASNIINNTLSLDQSASNTILFNAGSVTVDDNSTFSLSQEAIIESVAKTVSENMVDTIIDETKIFIIMVLT